MDSNPLPQKERSSVEATKDARSIPNDLSTCRVFEEAFSLDALKNHFKRFSQAKYDYIRRRPRVVPGYDKLDYRTFNSCVQLHLEAIARKVLNGSRTGKTLTSYQFSPFLETKVPKPHSPEMRTISVGTIRDAIVQRAISEYIEPHTESRLLDCVYGFRKAKSAKHAVLEVRRLISTGLVYVFEADLEKFFDTIRHDQLNDLISDLSIDLRAKHLLHRYLKSGRVLPEDVAAVRSSRTKQLSYRRTPRVIGVPQGGILSGMLTNLYLANFDKSMRSKFAGYIRYADDYVVCCSSVSEVQDARQCSSELLSLLGLKLNDGKSIDSNASVNPITFLGFSIGTTSISVSKKNIVRFKKRVELIISLYSKRPYPNSYKALIKHLAYKITGPTKEQLEAMDQHGPSIRLYQRCWIGFFSIVTNIRQVKDLDTWMLRKISRFAWQKCSIRLKKKDIRYLGLPSLVNILYRSRRRVKQPQPSVTQS